MKSILLIPVLLIMLAASSTRGLAQDNVGMARYSGANELAYPENTDMWIFMGSALGSEYGEEPFDPADPGAIGVVTMEPSAYQYFRKHGHYADGTMFLLTFHPALAESSPQLPGFVQGDLAAQEIHVIDSQRFDEGRGFYIFPPDATPGALAGKIPDGSECVECHMNEAQYNGTFTQFYPIMRDLPKN